MIRDHQSFARITCTAIVLLSAAECSFNPNLRTRVSGTTDSLGRLSSRKGRIYTESLSISL
jgi:hypothetical protein